MAHLITIPSDASGIPSVNPDAAPPADYQNIQTNASQFGAQIGAGEEALGAGALKAADFYDKAASEQAYTNYQKGVTNLLYGDPTKDGDVGFMGLHGDEAMKARPVVQQQIEELRKQAMDRLLTGKSQLDFDNSSRRLQANSYAQMGSHYEQQAHVWGASVQEGAMLEDQRRAANTYNDVEGLKHILADQDPRAMRLSEHNGKDPAAIASEARSKVISSAIDGALARGDTAAGQRLFDTFGSQLDPSRQASFGQHLLSRNRAAADDAIIDRMMGGPIPGTTGPGGRSGGAVSAGDHYGYLTSIGAKPNEAALLTSAAASESSFRPDIAHDGGIGYGLYGHNGDRLAAMRREAGTDKPSWQQQAKFALAELRSRPEGAEVNAAKTPEALTDLQMRFERPNREINDGNYAGRLAATREYMQSPPASTSDQAIANAAKPTGAGANGIVPIGAKVNPPAGAPIAIGDSIARGFQRFANAGGTGKDLDPNDTSVNASGGRSPSTILKYLKSLPDGSLNGKPVMLSTGVSNAPDEIGLVPDQLAELKRLGAGPVQVIGVGTKEGDEGGKHFNLAPYNAQIETATKEAGGTFLGGLPAVVHPERTYYKSALAAPAGAPGSPAAAPDAPPPDQLQGQPKPPASPLSTPVPYFPTREEWLSRIPKGLNEEDYNRIYGKAERRYSQMVQTTSADRAQALAQFKGGRAKLQDGSDFAYDPNTYRRLFPKDTADDMLGQLEDAKTLGEQVKRVTSMSIDEILQQREANKQVLASSTGEGYERQKHLAEAFTKASNTAIANKIFADAGPVPSQEALLSKIPEGLSDEDRNHITAQLNQRFTHLQQATSDDRKQVAAQYQGGVAMLQDGRPFDLDGVSARIRSLYPPDKADEMIGNLEDAARIGQDRTELHGMSPADIAAHKAENQALLNQNLGPNYARYAARSKAFDQAAEQHLKALAEDPAFYVTATNPAIFAARQASVTETPEQSAALRAQGLPDATESLAAKILGEQERLQVPEDMRHVMPTEVSQGIAQRIMGDPEHAPANLKELQQRWGTAWPQVWRDIVGVGKLAPAYQMVGALENEGDGALLARALASSNKAGVSASIDKLLDDKVAGAVPPSKTITTAIANKQEIHDYKRSMLASGASPDQVEGIVNAIGLLAKAKALYHNEDPNDAADHAVESAIGKWEFMPNGGARVPRENFDAITDSAHEAIAGLTLNQLAAPPRFAEQMPNDQALTPPTTPGMPTADDWLRLLKAAPNWITTGQSIRLMDTGGRFVRRKDGGFVEVPFTAKPTARPALGAPDQPRFMPY